MKNYILFDARDKVFSFVEHFNITNVMETKSTLFYKFL